MHIAAAFLICVIAIAHPDSRHTNKLGVSSVDNSAAPTWTNGFGLMYVPGMSSLGSRAAGTIGAVA